MACYSCGRLFSSTCNGFLSGQKVLFSTSPRPSSCAWWIMLWSSREGWISACVTDRDRKRSGKGAFVCKLSRCVCVRVECSRRINHIHCPFLSGMRAHPRDSYSGPFCCWQKGLMGSSDHPICRDKNVTTWLHFSAPFSITSFWWVFPSHNKALTLTLTI